MRDATLDIVYSFQLRKFKAARTQDYATFEELFGSVYVSRETFPGKQAAALEKAAERGITFAVTDDGDNPGPVRPELKVGQRWRKGKQEVVLWFVGDVRVAGTRLDTKEAKAAELTREAMAAWTYVEDVEPHRSVPVNTTTGLRVLKWDEDEKPVHEMTYQEYVDSPEGQKLMKSLLAYTVPVGRMAGVGMKDLQFIDPLTHWKGAIRQALARGDSIPDQVRAQYDEECASRR